MCGIARFTGHYLVSMCFHDLLSVYIIAVIRKQKRTGVESRVDDIIRNMHNVNDR